MAKRPIANILSRDPDFSASLGYGPKKSMDLAALAPSEPKVQAPPPAPAFDTKPTEPAPNAAPPTVSKDVKVEAAPKAATPALAILEVKPVEAPAKVRQIEPNPQIGASIRVDTSVSVPDSLAVRFDKWALAANCPASALMRLVARSAKDEAFADWAKSGLPKDSNVFRQAGKHTTSVSLSMTQTLHDSIEAIHDPMRLRGLGRIIGPSFRKVFNVVLERKMSEAGY